MDKIAQARSRLLINHVFFASLLLGTPAVEDRTVETAYTTGKKIGYNPDFLRSLEVPVIEFVFAHEVLHDMFLHMLRMQGRNPRLWNIACDYAINLILKKSGFTLWEHCLYDAKYEGMSAEQIYDALQKQLDEERAKRKANGQGGDPLDEMATDPLHGDVKEPENADAETIAKIKQEVQQRVAQATTMARMAGKIPGGMERFIENLLNPSAPWEELLKDFMTRIVHEDESWSRRNRRFQVFLPTRYNHKLGEIIHIGDTSGSIQNKELQKVGAETGYIAENLDPERMRFVWWDARLQNEETFEQGDALKLNPKGGGGTRMDLALKYVEQYNPQVVILHTDGYTPWPDEPTPYPLIICCTTDKECPAWANTVRIKV